MNLKNVEAAPSSTSPSPVSCRQHNLNWLIQLFVCVIHECLYNVHVSIKRFNSLLIATSFAAILGTQLCLPSQQAYALFNGDKRLQQGKAYLDEQAYSLALQELTIAVKENPGSITAHCLKAAALAGLGQDDAAMQDFIEALKMDKKNPEVHRELGLFYLRRGSWEEAGQQFRQVLDVSPDDLMAHGNLGVCYMQVQQYRSASEHFQLVAKRDPINIEAHFNLGTVYELNEQFEEAALEYRRTIELNPRHFMAYVGLGKCMLREGDAKSAIALQKRAIEMFPKNYWSYLVLGAAYEQQGQNDKAEAAFRQAIKINPKDPGCRMILDRMLKKNLAAKTGVNF